MPWRRDRVSDPVSPDEGAHEGSAELPGPRLGQTLGAGAARRDAVSAGASAQTRRERRRRGSSAVVRIPRLAFRRQRESPPAPAVVTVRLRSGTGGSPRS